MSEDRKGLNFIEQIIEQDKAKGKTRVHTRFPPEPNGYLHVGHAQSIWLNFTLAQKYGGLTNLRFDDTNPLREDDEFVRSIQRDIEWLGFKWHDKPYYASDYFGQLYDWATLLIKKGLAYVDDSTQDEMKEMRGTTTIPGTPSKYRDRSVEENLDLFERMRKGEFVDGEKVLRAKIDMSSPNMHLRDPALYRIMNVPHHRTGDDWCIYPMYDFAHGQSDFIENITHSICTLEFEVHRPLYDWLLDQITDETERPRQIEFARLNLAYTITSKRKLKQLVDEGIVSGWDDPRMPTISGMRRRGYTPQSIRNFCERAGVAKRNSLTDMALLEFSVRECLNKEAERVLAVLDPLKVTITNYPEDKTEELSMITNPENPELGSHSMPFSRTIYIERSDFMEDAPKKFFRLAPGRDVRLKGAYIIHCDEVIKDDNGGIVELKCSYYANSKSGQDESGVKVKGTIHWVSIEHAITAEVRVYDRLFVNEVPTNVEEGQSFLDNINPNSMKIVKQAYLEPYLKDAKMNTSYQFLRNGYFVLDQDSTSEHLIFNKTVGLRDSWSKIQNK